jgi:hypothetical protein
MTKDRLSHIKPKRIDALMRQFDDELLVVDARRHRGHGLNKSAAGVWLACDGKTSVTRLVADRSRHGMTEPMVWLALHRLRRAHLLEPESVPKDIRIERRRDALRKLGAAAGLLVPVITSMLIPPPANAASCFALLHSCASNVQCCSGHCGLSGVKLVCLP